MVIAESFCYPVIFQSAFQPTSYYAGHPGRKLNARAKSYDRVVLSSLFAAGTYFVQSRIWDGLQHSQFNFVIIPILRLDLKRGSNIRGLEKHCKILQSSGIGIQRSG